MQPHNDAGAPSVASTLPQPLATIYGSVEAVCSDLPVKLSSFPREVEADIQQKLLQLSAELPILEASVEIFRNYPAHLVVPTPHQYVWRYEMTDYQDAITCIVKLRLKTGHTRRIKKKARPSATCDLSGISQQTIKVELTEEELENFQDLLRAQKIEDSLSHQYLSPARQNIRTEPGINSGNQTDDSSDKPAEAVIEGALRHENNKVIDRELNAHLPHDIYLKEKKEQAEKQTFDDVQRDDIFQTQSVVPDHVIDQQSKAIKGAEPKLDEPVKPEAEFLHAQSIVPEHPPASTPKPPPEVLVMHSGPQAKQKEEVLVSHSIAAPHHHQPNPGATMPPSAFDEATYETTMPKVERLAAPERAGRATKPSPEAVPVQTQQVKTKSERPFPKPQPIKQSARVEPTKAVATPTKSAPIPEKPAPTAELRVTQQPEKTAKPIRQVSPEQVLAQPKETQIRVPEELVAKETIQEIAQPKKKPAKVISPEAIVIAAAPKPDKAKPSKAKIDAAPTNEETVETDEPTSENDDRRVEKEAREPEGPVAETEITEEAKVTKKASKKEKQAPGKTEKTPTKKETITISGIDKKLYNILMVNSTESVESRLARLIERSYRDFGFSSANRMRQFMSDYGGRLTRLNRLLSDPENEKEGSGLFGSSKKEDGEKSWLEKWEENLNKQREEAEQKGNESPEDAYMHGQDDEFSWQPDMAAASGSGEINRAEIEEIQRQEFYKNSHLDTPENVTCSGKCNECQFRHTCNKGQAVVRGLEANIAKQQSRSRQMTGKSLGKKKTIGKSMSTGRSQPSRSMGMGGLAG